MGILEDFSKRKKAQKEAVPDFLYHGTGVADAEAIETEGISMDASGKGYFGQGFYLAVDPALAKSNYADFADEEEAGVVLQYGVKPEARLLDLRDSDDWDTWKASGLDQQIWKDGFAAMAVASGIDGLYDESFGGYVIYNPDVLGLIGRWEPEQRTAQNGLENYKRTVEYVPTETVKKFMHVDRSNPEMTHYDEADWEELKASVAEGWTDPLMILYFSRDKTAILGEGNHRLQAAIALGIEEIPVRVWRMSMEGRDSSYADNVVDVPGMEPDRHGYVPADLKPSDIGII
jgi:hypothetical protein